MITIERLIGLGLCGVDFGYLYALILLICLGFGFGDDLAPIREYKDIIPNPEHKYSFLNYFFISFKMYRNSN